MKTIMMLCAVLLITPINALEIKRLIIRRIQMMQEYIATTLPTKGFSKPNVKENGSIPVVWMGAVCTIMAGFGIQGLVSLRASNKNSEDKKKEVFPNIVVEDSDLQRTSSSTTQTNTASSHPENRAAADAVEAPISKNTMEGSSQALQKRTQKSVTYASQISEPPKLSNEDGEEEFFPEPSNEEYDLGSRVYNEAFDLTDVSISNIVTLQKPFIPESPTIERQSTIATEELVQEKSPQPVSATKKLKKEAKERKVTSKKNKGAVKHGIRDVSEDFEVDLSELGIYDQASMINNKDVQNPQVEAIKRLADIKTMASTTRALEHPEIEKRNDTMTNEFIDAIVQDRENKLHKEQIGVIMQIVGNNNIHNPRITIEISPDEIPKNQEDDFYNSLKKCVARKKFTETVFLRKKTASGWYELPLDLFFPPSPFPQRTRSTAHIDTEVAKTEDTSKNT